MINSLNKLVCKVRSHRVYGWVATYWNPRWQMYEGYCYRCRQRVSIKKLHEKSPGLTGSPK